MRIDAFPHPRLRLAGAGLLIVAILAADVSTPADNVSLCFAYTLPILIGVYTGAGTAYALAAASTAASILGSLLEPPTLAIAVTFVANRVIAVIAQWLVAILVEQHKRGRAALQARLALERAAAESGRRFVQILTHEVGSALSAISGQSYRLSRLASEITPQDIVARADKIRAGVARLDTLVSRVQAASEISEGALAVRPERIDAPAFVEALRAEHEGSEIIVEARCEATVILADPDLLHRAVGNLIANAEKYSAPPARVTLAVTEDASGIVIAVGDQGLGIPEDELGRVFEPYYRARNVAGIRGLGIGLHLVRHLVEAQGGTVRIESRLGEGTRVSLHLAAPPRRRP